MVTDESDPIRLAAIETASRIARVWPRELAPRVGSGLRDPDVRKRAGAADVLCRLPDGVVRPHIPIFLECLDDPDDCVAALAVLTLSSAASSFPEVLAPHVDSVRPFLDEEWMGDESGDMRLVYSTADRHATESTDEPGGRRLTDRVLRPLPAAVSLLVDVAQSHPAAVTPAIPRLAEIASAERLMLTYDLVTVFQRVARHDPAAIEPAMPVIEEWAERSDAPGRVGARNLLRELGREIPLDEPLDPPERMLPRDRAPQPGDEDVLHGIDERALRGKIDLDRVLPLLRSTDLETRRTVRGV